MGRPSDFTDALADLICGRIADGESLRSICTDETMPGRRTVLEWLGRHESFRAKYAGAREAQADALFDEMLDIADDGDNDWMERKGADGQSLGWRENGEATRRSDIRIKTRQWMASRLAPKKYGERLALTGADGGAIELRHTAQDMSDDELARIATGGGTGAATEKARS